MSMDLYIYVGPYIKCHAVFEWDDFDDVVADGRGEAGVNEDGYTLVPNKKLPGVNRQMTYDKFSEFPVAQIEADQVDAEIEAMKRQCCVFLAWLRKERIEHELKWGIVPCWS